MTALQASHSPPIILPLGFINWPKVLVASKGYHNQYLCEEFWIMVRQWIMDWKRCGSGLTYGAILKSSWWRWKIDKNLSHDSLYFSSDLTAYVPDTSQKYYQWAYLLSCVNRMARLKGHIKKCMAEANKTAWQTCKEGWYMGPSPLQYSTSLIITNFTEIYKLSIIFWSEQAVGA